MKKKFLWILLILFTISTLDAVARDSTRVNRKKLFDRGIVQHTFLPKKQWLTGVNFSYFVTNSDNFKLLMLDQVNGEAYTLSVSPFLGYTVLDNLSVGLRFKYDRTFVNIDRARLQVVDDVELEVNNAYAIQHTYYGTAFLRNYISLGESMRFGLYNELQLTLGGGQGKTTSGVDESFTGTYQNTFEFALGMNPGVVAFVSNLVAVELSVGLMGFTVTTIDQTTDRVYKGSLRTTSANFKIDIFSISLGISFYIPTLNPF